MNLRAPVNPRTLLTWLGLLFGAAGLILQFTISMQSMLGSGRDLFGSLGAFFSYYTILTNIVLVLIYLSEVLPAGWLALFRHPVLRGMMAANIALVALYVFFVLRYLSVLTGLFQVADSILHYLCPVLYLLWWLIAQPHGNLRWGNLPVMLAPTLVYFLYAMARGAWVQEYPYPILNAIELGYAQVALNAVYMTAGLALLTLIVIALDRLLARPSRTLQ
ncbi:Pr6Pr family membrane protein [Devosia ginsengisoli]|uniref:Pr6Pr family membrane protein n=1 Tax=Devosia ginsengisoli TaxID=400770 RepID=UPI0026ED7383|nr:Pr6Pr family membrane protein [Devosia ginsengisoli]MCR6673693.1 Pr6Pr family membrane protein [Devosia ginsengisoli]